MRGSPDFFGRAGSPLPAAPFAIHAAAARYLPKAKRGLGRLCLTRSVELTPYFLISRYVRDCTRLVPGCNSSMRICFKNQRPSIFCAETTSKRLPN
jgi:hypothetical protein